jgi:phage tail-like protein
MDDSTLISPFNFRVEIYPSGYGGDEVLALDGRGAFAEVQGLEMSLEVVSFREGGYNQGQRQLIGKATTQPLVLKRGLSLDRGFWLWIQRCMSGAFPLPYVNGRILAFPPEGERNQVAIWGFESGIATKVNAGALNAKGAQDVAMEELQIVHERLWREVP